MKQQTPICILLSYFQLWNQVQIHMKTSHWLFLLNDSDINLGYFWSGFGEKMHGWYGTESTILVLCSILLHWRLIHSTKSFTSVASFTISPLQSWAWANHIWGAMYALWRKRPIYWSGWELQMEPIDAGIIDALYITNMAKERKLYISMDGCLDSPIQVLWHRHWKHGEGAKSFAFHPIWTCSELFVHSNWTEYWPEYWLNILCTPPNVFQQEVFLRCLSGHHCSHWIFHQMSPRYVSDLDIFMHEYSARSTKSPEAQSGKNNQEIVRKRVCILYQTIFCSCCFGFFYELKVCRLRFRK